MYICRNFFNNQKKNLKLFFVCQKFNLKIHLNFKKGQVNLIIKYCENYNNYILKLCEIDSNYKILNIKWTKDIVERINIINLATILIENNCVR